MSDIHKLQKCITIKCEPLEPVTINTSLLDQPIQCCKINTANRNVSFPLLTPSPRKFSLSLSLSLCHTHTHTFLINYKIDQARCLMPVIPALSEAKVDGSPEVKSSRPAWPNWRNPFSTKYTKISQAWWHAPVMPALWEAEAGELLEPRRQRLQWAGNMPLHSSLGDRVRLCLKKKKIKN